MALIVRIYGDIKYLGLIHHSGENHITDRHPRISILTADNQTLMIVETLLKLLRRPGICCYFHFDGSDLRDILCAHWANQHLVSIYWVSCHRNLTGKTKKRLGQKKPTSIPAM